MIRQTVKRFCREEIAPHAEEWDEKGIFPRELFNRGGELGLFGIRIDPAHGGAGLDWWASAAYMEALSYSDSPSVNMAFMVQSELAVPFLSEMGSTEQKREFMEPAMRGDKIAALGISEPGGGSDVAAIRCTARQEGDEFVIRGQKLWITNGTRADFVLLAVRTGDDSHKGISFVTFPTDVKGYSVGKKLKKVGNLASDTAELFFDDCRIPARYLVGEKNRGFYYVMENFQGERLAAAIQSVAGMDRAIDYAIQYGKDRHAFGRPLGAMQVWKHRFAEMRAQVEAARWLVYRALDLFNRGQRAVREISMAKLVAADLSQRVMYDCQQIFGGFGYTTEYPISRLWRDARLMSVGGGASEVMKEIIAKQEGF